MAAINDIALVGYSSDAVPNGKSFAFVVLADLSGQVLNFTDNGYINASGLKTNEGTLTLTVPIGTAIGTVFTVTATNGTTSVTANGTAVPFTQTSTRVDFAVAGDQIAVYQGTAAAPTFLYALNFYAPGYGYTTTAANNSTDLPPGLTANATALTFTLDNAAYKGPLTGSKETILANIANVAANWASDDAAFVAYPGNFAVDGATTATIGFQSAALVQAEGDTAGVTAYTITLTRSAGASDATVAWAVTGTANGADAIDFGGAFPSGTATFTGANLTTTFTVNVAGDRTIEADEQFVVTLSAPSSGFQIAANGATQTETIVNDDVAGTISVADISVAENGSQAVLTLTRSGGSGDTSVTVATADGTATAGSDYTALSGTVTFANGATTAQVAVSLLNDALVEGNETFVLNVTPSVGGPTVATPQATVTIVDDDVTIIPAGSYATTFAANVATNYRLDAGTERNVTANVVGVTVSANNATVDIEGTLTGFQGARAIDGGANATGDTVLVGAGGTVTAANGDAIRFRAPTGNATIINLGQVLVTNNNAAPTVGGTNINNAHGIVLTAVQGPAGAAATDYTSGGRVTNGSATNTGAVIRSSAGDAVRLGSHQTLVNYGTIDGNGPINDAATNNSFRGTATTQTYGISRGVRIDDDGTANSNQGKSDRIDNFGTIAGAQHGIDFGDPDTANSIVVNEAGGQIIGRNGSGVGADTIGAAATTITVQNSGLIRGDRAATVVDRAGYTYANGSGDSDGDGVDIDGGATIVNNAGATIAGTGAAGYDSNGRLNASEGISIGGGIITNAGTIAGADAGIVTNNDSNANGSRSGVTATTITNNAGGTISGQASYAIRLENKTGTAADNDAIANYGTITGNAAVPTGTVLRQDGTADAGTLGTLDGTAYTAADAGNARFIRGDGAAIQMGEGNDGLANYGAITGNVSLRAINLEGGNDALTLFTGSTVSGRIDGGAGSDTLTLRLDDRPAANGGAAGNNSGATTGLLTNVISFETLDVASGTWTLADAQGYAAGITVENGAVLVLGTGAALTGAIVDNGRLTVNGTDAITLAGAISGSGVVEKAGSGTLTLAGGNSYAGGTTLTAGTLDVAVLGAAGSGAISFAAGAQTLRIETAALNGSVFGNVIAGYATDGDTIDVRGIGLATATYDGGTGVLTLAGTGNATLTLGSGYDAILFRTADDGAGGTAVTITAAPLPTLSISDPTVIEGGAGGAAMLHYVVTASAPAPTGGITFDIATADGTATAGDYTPRTVTGATIAAGQTTYAFDVAVTGDTAPERAETVLVNLTNPTRATIADAQGVGTIDNDDGAPAGLQPYFAADFTGFTAAGFAPVPTAAQLDSDVWRVVGLSDNTNPVYGGTYTTGDFARGVIAGSADPVSAGVYSPSANAALILQPTGAEIENGGFIEAQLVNTTGFTATAFDIAFDWAYRNSGARADALQFSYSTDGATFVTVPAAAFTTPGAADAAVAATFSLQNEALTIGNVLVGDGNALYLRWTHTASTGGGNRDEVGIDNVAVRATVSDVQTLSAPDVTVIEGTGGTSFATFTLTRSSGSGAASIGYATADGSALAGRDYTAASGTLTFAEGERTKTVTVAINPDTINESNETFFLNLSSPQGVSVTDTQARATILNDDTGPIAIYNIQGAAQTSPFAGQSVTTAGIVTAVNATGYWIQDPTGDGLFATSDGIQVFIGAAGPTGVAVGDRVTLTTTVTEFLPTTGALTVTELTAPTVVSVEHGFALPAPVLIGTHGILPPTNVIDDDRLQSYDPTSDGIDFYEALEGMLVTVEAPIVVGPSSGRTTYIVASGGEGATNINERGGITLTGDDAAPERLQIFADSTLLPGYNPDHTLGDILGNVTGIVQYYTYYEVLPTQAVTTTVDRTTTQEQTALRPDANHLQIASFNIENADPTDPQAKFDAIGVEVSNALGRPDIIGLQEVQDADGAGKGTDLSGTATAQKVIDAIVAAGGPRYSYVEIAPTATNTTGGEPDGNIRNGYLYNASRVTYVDGSATLIQDDAYTGTRRPLVANFTFNGQTVTVIDQHSTSRGGSDLYFGANQPPAQAGDAARTAQAMGIKTYIDGLQAANADAKVVVLGDFNGYYYEPALSTLTNDGKLTNLYTLLPVAERYSYLFEGAVQAFDNIVVTNNLLPQTQFDVVHYNAEQTVQPITDHDQAVASIYIPAPNTAPTDLAIDNASVAENAPAGTLVGTVTGVDREGGALSYTLTDGAGAGFAIDAATGRLTTTQPFDYETTKTATVTVRVTDAGGLSYTEQVAIAVTNVNEAPTAVTVGTAAVAENAAAGTLVATAAATDPDGDALRYSLLNNAAGLFAIDAATGRITTTAPLNYEAAATQAVTVRATDAAGLFVDRAVTVAVTDVNEAPAGVTISSASVTENAAGGTVIGTLSGNDPDAGDAVTFRLGGTDTRFQVNGNQLVVAAGAVIDYEVERSIALAVTATDRAGLATATTLTLAVQDVAEAFTGTPGNDTINGDAGANTISGGAGDDVLNGLGGADTIDGGDGSDIINGGAGADRITLGAGADTVRALLSELLGDTIIDFGQADRIVVQRSDLHRTDFQVTGTGASTAITFAGGTAGLAAGTTGGDLMVAHSGTDSIITFNPYLASLAETKAVDASAINGIVNQGYLTGDTSTSFTVKVDSLSNAKYSNTLGSYEIDTATGAISDVHIIAGNVKNAGGAITVTGVDAGHQLGFFIVQDGANKLSSAVIGSSTLSLVNQDGHLALANGGSIVAGATTFFSHAAAANVDGAAHVLSGVAADGSGDLRIGFEDLVRSGSTSDNDFQDVVLTVEAVPVAHPVATIPDALMAADAMHLVIG